MGPLWRDQFQVTRRWELAEVVAVFIVVGQDTAIVILEHLWLMIMDVFSYYFSSFQSISVKVCLQETKNTK